MLGTKAETDYPRPKAPQQWRHPNQSQQRRRRYFPGARENTADDPVLQRYLQPLGRPGRKFAAALHVGEVPLRNWALKARRKNIGGGDRVLDRK